MNKILIVGHPTTSFRDVERLLNECGMSPPIPSRREKLSPIEIGATILKAHGLPLLTEKGNADKIRQVEAGPVWQGLALDLMLGNTEQPLWGWADSNAIQLLEYWRALDPSIVFVLVYDNSATLLSRASTDLGDLSPTVLQRLVSDWCEYNGELLRFYHRNADRSLLVHAQQVQLSASLYLQQVRTRLSAPLSTLLHDTDEEGDLAQFTPTPLARISHSATASHVATAGTELKRYLAATVLNALPQVVELYEELQSVATLPFADPGEVKLAPLGAWNAAVQAEAKLHDLQRSSKQVRDELAVVQIGQKELRSQIESLLPIERLAAERLVEIGALVGKLSSQTERADTATTQLAEVQAKLYDLQLSSKQLRDELEVVQTERKELRNKIESLLPTERLAADRLVEIRALVEELRSQTQRADTATIQLVQVQDRLASSENDAQGESELLLTQLHQVQEALEQRYIENGKLRELAESLAPYKKQAERQLVQIETLNQKLAALDSLVNKHAQQIKQRDSKVAQLQKLEQMHVKRDAEFQRISKELTILRQRNKEQDTKIKALAQTDASERNDHSDADSERLKYQEIVEENTLLLMQLHKVQAELERYYIENKAIKKTAIIKPPAKPEKPEYYGAAERIKQQLTYRLGTIMIDHSRSFSGWISMIWALLRETRQFRAERAVTPSKKLPPIFQYKDAHEAERVKRHLSYRLGEKLLANVRSPLGWFRIPFTLRSEVVSFKQERFSRS